MADHDPRHVLSPRVSSPAPRLRVLVLCTGNAARSQMAEGLLRHLGGDRVEVESAGTVPSRVHPLAIQAMAEKGIDISGQRSKHLNELSGRAFDRVITVCDSAAASCPAFPGPAVRLHWSLPDPVSVPGTDADRLAAFRAVRDDLAFRLREWLADESGSE